MGGHVRPGSGATLRQNFRETALPHPFSPTRKVSPWVSMVPGSSQDGRNRRSRDFAIFGKDSGSAPLPPPTVRLNQSACPGTPMFSVVKPLSRVNSFFWSSARDNAKLVRTAIKQMHHVQKHNQGLRGRDSPRYGATLPEPNPAARLRSSSGVDSVFKHQGTCTVIHEVTLPLWQGWPHCKSL